MQECIIYDGGLVVVYIDIMLIKLVEELCYEIVMIEQVELLKVILENMLQGVVLINVDGFFEIWNQLFLFFIGMFDFNVS